MEDLHQILLLFPFTIANGLQCSLTNMFYSYMFPKCYPHFVWRVMGLVPSAVSLLVCIHHWSICRGLPTHVLTAPPGARQGQKARIATLYFPLVGILLENLHRLEGAAPAPAPAGGAAPVSRAASHRSTGTWQTSSSWAVTDGTSSLGNRNRSVPQHGDVADRQLLGRD